MKEIRYTSDFLNKELRGYAFDIIENRAIPSVIDGMKPTARKVIYTSNKIWKHGDEKPIKVFVLAAKTAAETFYHHGDQSINTVVTNLGQSFKGFTFLEGYGQYGSLRCPNAGAPRYISTKLSLNFRNLFKDFELLESRYEEGYEIEPKFFLPIIPTIITSNIGIGIAMGFASNILNRNPKEVVQACVDTLNGKKIKELKPWLSEFSGIYIRDTENKNKWYSKGIYQIIKNDVHITELPPNWTFEKYESYLDTLVDKKIIKDYDNNSSSGVDYLLKFKKDDLKELIEKGKLEDILKINDSSTENLTTLDENGKLKIFDCVEDIVKYFVNFRLGYYQKRKDYLLDKYNKELKELCFRAKFIKSIIDKKLKVNNVPKDDVVKWLEENKFDKIDGSFNYLLNMSIYSLTKEKYEELVNKAKQKKDLIDEVSEKNPKEMYLEDLYELKKKLK